MHHRRTTENARATVPETPIRRGGECVSGALAHGARNVPEPAACVKPGAHSSVASRPLRVVQVVSAAHARSATPRVQHGGLGAAPVAARIEAHDTPWVVEVSIFTRYVLRSHVVPAAAGLAIFYFVLSMDFIVDYLDLFIARGVPGLAVLEAFGLSLAWMTLLAVPMAVMVAVLTAFGRLAQDNEITAAKANGVPIFSLIAPVLVASALAACGLFYFGNHALSRAPTTV